MAYVERSNKFPSLELPKRFDDILHCTLHGENCSSSGIILFKTYPRSLPHVSAWRSISQSYFTDFRSVPRPDSSDYQGNDFAPPANFKAFRKIVGGLIAGAIEYYNYMRLRASEATAANNRVLDAHKLTQIPQQSTTSLAVIHRKSRPCTRPRSLETRPELHGVSECRVHRKRTQVSRDYPKNTGNAPYDGYIQPRSVDVRRHRNVNVVRNYKWWLARSSAELLAR